MNREEIPVYLINGFLESGKTSFLRFTISQDYFQTDETTLLILCEEGEEEYEEKNLAPYHTVIEVIDSEEEFNRETLLMLQEKHHPGRVIIEYNGMWSQEPLKEMPSYWMVNQQITLVDASTFKEYFANMKSLFLDMVRQSELIMFNRCVENQDLALYRRNIKAVNPEAEMIFEGKNGEINVVLEEDLPFDLHEEVIKIQDQDYGIWYLDAMEHPERYHGKIVRFRAMVLKPPRFEEGLFIPGRKVMTCCADDLTFLGYVCKSKEASELKNRQWIYVTAEVKKEYYEGYQGEGPVLYAQKIVKTAPPKEELVSF